MSMNTTTRITTFQGTPGPITLVFLTGTYDDRIKDFKDDDINYTYWFDYTFCRFLAGETIADKVIEEFEFTYANFLKKEDDKIESLTRAKAHIRGFQQASNLSVYAVPQGMRMRFILRGQFLDRLWVDRYLAQPKSYPSPF